jgi:serine/threonine protein kinase
MEKYIDEKEINNEEVQIDPELFNKNKPLFTTIKTEDTTKKKKKSPQSQNRNEDEASQYNWIKIIGQGTFGVVYKAELIKDKKKVAIKKVYQDPKYSNREFKIVVELDHPNCIKVHHYFFTKKEGSEDVFLNLVMDYMPDTLYKIFRFYYKKNYAFPNALGKIYSYQMFRALAYIHNVNICHRDIKPQNILIDIKDHKLVLCDFGSAKKLEKGQTSVSYICSRYYRAPELILGEEAYDCQIDVWSIGCVIAEMFLGIPLFSGKNSKDQFLKIMNVLGTPTQEDIEGMCDSVQVNLPEIKGCGLDKKLKNADPLLIDLLNKVLIYNPKKRIKPFKALAHPYFDDLRAQKLTINGRKFTDLFNFTPIEIGKYKKLAKDLVPSWYNK